MNPDLADRKYVLAGKLITPAMAAVCARYAVAQREHHFQGGDPQAPSSHSVWGDFLTEALLETLRPVIEKIAGIQLVPTYSFYRVYVPGEELLAHRDRAACEVSCSVCLGYDYRGKDYQWRIVMGERRLALDPGDAVVYLGCEIEHSRPPLLAPAGSWHAQAFLHYVASDGPNRDQRFDGRPALFEPRVK